MADVHARLERADFLRGLTASQFAGGAGGLIGDINYVHPFREGNGRAQLQYLALLAAQAGHPVDVTRLDPGRWHAASRASHSGDYQPMTAEIAQAIVGR
jgi:cell filamentation protein